MKHTPQQAYIAVVRQLEPRWLADLNEAAFRTEIRRLVALDYDGDDIARLAVVGIVGAKSPAAVVLTRLRAITEPKPQPSPTPTPPTYRPEPNTGVSDAQRAVHLARLREILAGGDGA